MALVQEKRGIYKDTEYLTSDKSDTSRVILHYEMPLSSILVDFYDKLKSVSSGYASLNYDFLEYRSANVVRMDIIVAEEHVDALSSIVYRDEAERVGRRIVETLKGLAGELTPEERAEYEAMAEGILGEEDRITIIAFLLKDHFSADAARNVLDEAGRSDEANPSDDGPAGKGDAGGSSSAGPRGSSGSGAEKLPAQRRRRRRRRGGGGGA